MPEPAQFARICCAIAGTAAVPLLWGMGLVGGGKYDEHVATWEITIRGRDGDGLLVGENIVVDFGNEYRSSMDRRIDGGLGAPDKVFGQPAYPSPGQPLPGPGMTITFDLTEQPLERREGSTIARLQTEYGRSTGVQILTAAYVLPLGPSIGEPFEYELIAGGRAIDANDVYVFIDGMDVESPTCTRGSGAPCEVSTEDGFYAIELSSLPAGDSLTIGGTVTGWTEHVDLPSAELARPREAPGGDRWLFWLLALPGAAGGFEAARAVWRRRSAACWQTHRVPQTPLVAGATAGPLEPLPPLSSWKGSVLVHHEIGLTSAAAWFADAVARGVLSLETVKGSVVLRRGPSFERADLGLRDQLQRMFGRDDTVRLDPFDRPVKRVIAAIADRQRAALQEHRWWRRFAPGGSEWFSPEVAMVLAGWAVALGLLIATNWSYSWPVAFALLFVVPATTNAAVAWWMAPQLGLEGNEQVAALAPLRQMLRDANTSHVEAAHRAGLLPEYSAWAVALGAANRWRDAVRAADLPDDAAAAALAPLEMGRNGGPFSNTADFPSNELRPPLRPQAADA